MVTVKTLSLLNTYHVQQIDLLSELFQREVLPALGEYYDCVYYFYQYYIIIIIVFIIVITIILLSSYLPNKRFL